MGQVLRQYFVQSDVGYESVWHFDDIRIVLYRILEIKSTFMLVFIMKSIRVALTSVMLRTMFTLFNQLPNNELFGLSK